MSKTRLIGSAGSLDQITQAISRFYYSTITLEAVSPSQWMVRNSRGVIDGVQVRLVKSRYRFEMEVES